MNVETLNHWGEDFLSFAWPILWQSSLLIAIVFALDVLLARKVRAAVRHALWLVVLVKLLLPPALALPTGVAWWLWPAKPPWAPVSNNSIVTIDVGAAPMDFVQPPNLTDSLSAGISMAGIVVPASILISAGLLLWLVFRWLGVAQKIHRSSASANFSEILEEARRLAGLRRSPGLKLMQEAQSPAVYGLFRPVILLPRALAEKLSDRQLRAVLLHEAIHLRRRDVWINFAQTMLQIAYWWHPLLWIANARIRRLREEAVDVEVMLALRDEAEIYAPTLLETARFAFRRPLASLGLIGILESRSALRRRIERLTDFRPPRRAGLTLLSLFGIIAFSSVALPMGQATVADEKSNLAQPVSDVITNAANQTVERAAEVLNEAPAEKNALQLRPTPTAVSLHASADSRDFISDPLAAVQPFDTRTVTSFADLEHRIYPVDYYGFPAAVTRKTGQMDWITGFKELASQAGVDLSPPKAVFLDGMNVLFVYAAKKDLDALAPVIADLHCPPPMVQIKARFMEVAKPFLSGESLPAGVTNGGILTPGEMKSFLRQIESKKGVAELAAGEATTIGGRPIQVCATEDDPIITNPGSAIPKIGYIEIGSVLDAAPTILYGDHKILVQAKASRIEWFGYPGLTNAPLRFATNAAGKKITQPNSLHPILLSQPFAQKILYDGQTLVLFPKPEELLFCEPDDKRAIADFIRRNEQKYQGNVLVAFITATIIDSVGNRLHSDGEPPFAPTEIPARSP